MLCLFLRKMFSYEPNVENIFRHLAHMKKSPKAKNDHQRDFGNGGRKPSPIDQIPVGFSGIW